MMTGVYIQGIMEKWNSGMLGPYLILFKQEIFPIIPTYLENTNDFCIIEFQKFHLG
jgi:hypothetical protein